MERKKIKIDLTPIKLSLDTRLMLERVDNKIKVIQQQRPFEGRMLNQVKEFFKIETVWSSEAMEGNSLTLSETKVLLEDGITVSGKPLKDVLRTTGHADAYDFMFSLLNNDNLTIEDIIEMHRLLMQKDDSEIAGKYKEQENFISGSGYTTIPKKEVEYEMERLRKWMEDGKNNLHPLIYATELHRVLVYIHPFQDGNGRTARLAMNTVLIQNGYLPCPISPVVRLEYYESLESGRNGNRDRFAYLIAEIEHETEKDFGRYLDIDFNV